jgi:hypothetical protein
MRGKYRPSKEKDMLRWIQQFWLEALEEKKSET